MILEDSHLKEKNKAFLSILLKGWNNLLDDYDKWEFDRVFWHGREEDLRTYLFHKIMNELEHRKMAWWETLLRTEITYRRKRLDLALGYNPDDDSYDVGVELKPYLSKKSMIKDVVKLKTLLVNSHLKTGVFLGIGARREPWPQILSTWFEDTGITLDDEKDGKNYWIVRTLKPITVNNQIKRFDAIQIILRDV